MTSLQLLINNTVNDTTVVNVGTDWLTVDPNYDVFIFSGGSVLGGGVSNGDVIPSEALLNRYAVQLDPINPVNVPKYFLADYSLNLLKEIKLAGNQNKRYVFAAQFDGATATEPQLEAWDTASMDTIVSPALGAGTPASSWYKAISTNLSLPGVNWVGTSLAGSGVSNILLMNDGAGALAVASTLYFNFKIVIPGGYLTPVVATPVLSIVYTTN
jgi:hypothetical protein